MDEEEDDEEGLFFVEEEDNVVDEEEVELDLEEYSLDFNLDFVLTLVEPELFLFRVPKE